MVARQSSFKEHFIKAGQYTAGLTAKYGDSQITNAAGSTDSLAANLVVGMRFPSAQVVRFCDAKAMQLVQALPADGRWRVIIFGGDITERANATRLEELGDYLYAPTGPVISHTPASADIDSFIETIVVLSGRRVRIEQSQIPSCFSPVTGKWKMHGLWPLLFFENVDLADSIFIKIYTKFILMMRAIIPGMGRHMRLMALTQAEARW